MSKINGHSFLAYFQTILNKHILLNANTTLRKKREKNDPLNSTFLHICINYWLIFQEILKHHFITHLLCLYFLCVGLTISYSVKSDARVKKGKWKIRINKNPNKSYTCDVCNVVIVGGKAFRRHCKIHISTDQGMCIFLFILLKQN